MDRGQHRTVTVVSTCYRPVVSERIPIKRLDDRGLGSSMKSRLRAPKSVGLDTVVLNTEAAGQIVGQKDSEHSF